MKRYLAFYGQDYYPERGMGNFIGDFDLLEDAVYAIDDKKLEYSDGDSEWTLEWGIVYDCESRSNVFEKR